MPEHESPEPLERRLTNPALPMAAGTSSPDGYPSNGNAWYVVGVLTLAYVVSFIDRQILSLLFGPIRSWQLVFLIVGLPGLLITLLLFTIREPVRQGARRLTEGPIPAATATMSEVWAYIRDNRGTFLCLNLGMALVTLNAYGMTAWVPTMFMRRHGWSPGDTGMIFGLIVAVSGTLGLLTGGRLADWLSEQGRTDAAMRVATLAAIGFLPFGLAFPLVPLASWGAVLVAPALFFSSIPFGVAPAAIQRMMPNPMRAQATAVYLFVINLIGMGLGPTVVATLTVDVFQNENAVHYSLAIVGGITQAAAGVLLWIGLKHYRRSIEYFKAWNEAHG